jgi:hypothetical protein
MKIIIFWDAMPYSLFPPTLHTTLLDIIFILEVEGSMSLRNVS